MDEPQLAAEPSQPGPETPHMSLAARLLNVFAVPGDVFRELKSAPPANSNWLVPAVCYAIMGMVSAWIIFSQPAVLQQLREQQAKAVDKQVQAGKLTQAQADQTLNLMDKFLGPTTLKLAAGAGALVGSFIHVVWWGFVLWWLAKAFLKVTVPFAKTLEVAGLATMITVLGVIVRMLLTVNFERIGATPSLALTISNFDSTRKSHLFLGAANVFYFWLVGVMSIGLAKLTGAPFLRSAWLVLSFWLIQECFFILVGLGQLAL